MTREEREYAIDIIQSILDKYEEDECLVTEITIGDEDIEALKLAIKALEQESTTKNDLGVDAISRIETIDYLCKHCPDDGECFKDCDEIKHLRNLPSVTPQPKTGHWIEHEHNGIAHIECSECSSWFLRPHLIRNRYCPNCGAKMTETEG